MPFNNSLTRTGVQALIPESVSRDIIQGVPKESMIMRLGKKLPNLPQSVSRMPVLSALPTAYFVNGDTGLKQTTQMLWDNKYLYVEELAVIVPIPEAVLADTSYDIWGEVKPRIIEAFGVAFDAAVIHDTNAPASWPDGLVTGATAAGNTVDLSDSVDVYEAVMGENGVIAKVEEDGFMVTGHLASLTMRGKYRGLRDENGQPIFVQTMQATTTYAIDGQPAIFSENGALDATQALQISGSFRELVWAPRQDMSYKLLTEAVLTDGSGNIILNLAQQDAVALRAVMRLAWQIPNPINRVQQTESARYPFAVLKP